MGILLSKGIDKVVDEVTIEGTPIFIKGTDIELTSVYVRVEFKAGIDGKSLTIYPSVFLNQYEYSQGNSLATNVNTKPFEVAILETEIQSIDTALSYSIEKFIDYGFSAEII
tara:strand:- start:26193 stop:26528 length:336 start_codon:yes stop_codon:yes gene_type:complete